MDESETKYLQESIETILEPFGFEISPLKIGWYNAKVNPAFQFPYDDDVLAFCVVSTPSMFDKAFKPYVNSLNALSSRDPLDDCVAKHLQQVQLGIPQWCRCNAGMPCLAGGSESISEVLLSIHDRRVIYIADYEMHPNRRPKVLVQTAGHVSGAACYYQRSDMNSDPWGEQAMYGVSIHPKYGGWFAFRGILIFPDVRCPNLIQKPPSNVIRSDEDLQELLEKFNGNWKDNRWRETLDSNQYRYSDEQIEYFKTLPADRGKLLGLTSNDESTGERRAERFH